jgi:hypothetical protein
MRSYPIVFAGNGNLPVAVQGLERVNLFVGRDGQWADRHYLPAYLRRYPFVLIGQPGGKGFVLGIGLRLDLSHSVDNEWLCAALLVEVGFHIASTEIGRFGE